MDMAIALVGNIKYREMIKLEMFELSLIKFDAAIKEKADASNTTPMVQKFKENYENEKYISTKTKFKDYGKMAVKLIAEKKEQEKNREPEPDYHREKIINRVNQFQKKPRPSPASTEEFNFDLGSFIATVAEEALLKDITQIKIANIELLPGGLSEAGKGYSPRDDRLLEEEKKMGRFPGMESLSRVRSSQMMPQPVSLAPEEKNIFRYKIRKRFDRYGRPVIDKIFDEDENDYTTHNKEFYDREFQQRTPVLTSEVVERLHNGKGGSKDPNHEYENLHEMYADRFTKFREIYPFIDSDDDMDLSEYSKQVKKNVASSFKTFLKTRRQQFPQSLAVMQ